MNRAQRHARWQAEAMKRGWPALRRWPLAACYGLVVVLRQLAFRLGWFKTHRLPVPVIVIGNVVAGGAGKTPTVLALVEHLRRRGWSPGVISRGHGRQGHQTVEVGPQTKASEGGDEPVLIQRRTGVPVFVGADRAAAGRALLARHPQVNLLLCDDGLQHLALHGDVTVVVFDERGVGNGWLLPAGLLRENWPPGRWARQVDLLLLQHREDRPPPSVTLPPSSAGFLGRRRLAPTLTSPDGQQRPLQHLAGTAFVAVAGLAQPGRFFDMLHASGCPPTRTWPLADHASAQAYRPVLALDLPVVCTDKDLPKLAEVLTPESPPVWSVSLELEIESGFFSALDARLPSVMARSGQQPQPPQDR